jgi:hypothetical protein
MSRYTDKCPACGATLTPGQIGYVPSCSQCGERLHYSLPYSWAIWPLGALVSATISYLYGLRGFTFGLTALLGSLPLYAIMTFLAGFIFAPKLVSKNSSLRIRS